MNPKKIQKIMEDFHYWDARVIKFECKYLADEIELTHENEEFSNIVYKFIGCYKTYFDHVKNYDKRMPAKEMTRAQIPYFLQDIEVSITEEEGVNFYVCKIDMFPMDVEIWCKDIEVFKKDK